jgi:hypothetical protein
VVAGLSGPTTSERVANATTVVEAGEKNFNTQPVETKGVRPADEDTQVHDLQALEFQTPRPQTPDPDDDAEEVSWQNAARASLEQETRTPAKLSSTPVARKVENPSPKVDAKPVEARAVTQRNPEPPPPTEHFTQEELPADFWSNAQEQPPASSYDDETFETATSGSGGGGRTRGVSKSNVKLPFEMPLFNELQALFPGRIVRIDVKQHKQAEESEEGTEQANEAVNAAESEDSE